jgi:NADH:ubiquinone oxidoreductase subunit K
MEISLAHYLALAAILFGIGMFGVLTRRNAVGILMSIELMFNAVNINLVARPPILPARYFRYL